MPEYPVVLIPRGVRGSVGPSRFYIADEPPAQRQEITVVERDNDGVDVCHIRLRVEAIEDRYDPPRITATTID